MAGTEPQREPPEGGRGEPRRLARAPAQRYTAPRAPAAGPGGTNAGGRGWALVVGAVVLGAVAIVVLAGLFAVSFGLLVVAFLVGRYVGIGCRAALSGRSSVGRAALAVGIAVTTIALGQVGVWLYAQSEGGVLPLTDYLEQTFGAVVPLQIVITAATAWWSAR